MALISCYSSLLRDINNTRPVCCSSRSLEFQIARALSYNRYSQRNKKIYNSADCLCFLVSCFGTRRNFTNRSIQALAFKETELTENPCNEEEEDKMTIKPSVKLADGKLTVKNLTVLTAVPNEVISTSGSDSGQSDGLFLGANLDEEKSRHVIRLGTLRSVRFLACFRFKLWWMAQKTGRDGSEIPLETQFLLVNAGEGVNAVFLPLLEGSFRASLQGNEDDDGLEICIESGDLAIKASLFERAVYVHFGPDPFEAVSEAVAAVQRHVGTFRRRDEKRVPGIADVFGWCTWDAFYQDVTREGVEAGLRSLAEGGSPARFVIIDDGWQSVAPDHETVGGIDRLTGIQENSKFREPAGSVKGAGIESLVEMAKKKLGVKYVYVWHAIIGYWGGVRPGVGGFGAETRRVAVSKGVMANEPAWKTDKMAAEEGLGLVDPRRVNEFYEELHSYLARAGVDGVKVDVQCILETLGAGLGGRVELTRRYHQALDASVARNFPDNGCIACMSHNTDALYCSKQTAIVRASDDFYPRDEMSHTIHIASVAYNSMFLGEFMQPDWDMFHSLHPAADYHASARAISGGPIYVSDAPGKHDFELLKKLVLPNGTVLRPRLPGRPTQDCLFSDPTRDGVSLLKIWNMNKHTGVLGVYNCQGAAWSASERKNAFHTPPAEETIAGHVSSRDVHLISKAAVGPGWDGDCAVHRFNSGELVVLRRDDTLSLSLGVLEHEMFTVSPIHEVGPGVRFAPLGLVGMYNSGGAVDGLSYESEAVCMEVKGCGVFGAYSSVEPRRCVVDSRAVDFAYDNTSGMVTFDLSNLPEEGQLHDVKVDL